MSMLVSVLGLRSIGILVADTFALQPFTWQIVSCDKSRCSTDKHIKDNRVSGLCGLGCRHTRDLVPKRHPPKSSTEGMSHPFALHDASRFVL